MPPGSLGGVLMLVLAVGLLSGEVVTRSWYDDCTFSPSGDNPTSMECRFKSKEAHVRQSPPYSIESFRITGGQHVIVDRDVLVSFKRLRSIHITGVETFNIHQNSLFQIKQQNAISLTVEQVGIVLLGPGALSDWQDPGSKISLKNIRQITISEQALPSTSTFHDVVIENVSSLYMEKESVQARIQYLKLLKVNLGICMRNTFNGHIRHMSLVSVSCGNLYPGCITGKPGWKSLTVHSSNLSYVQTSGVQGTIENIQIEHSELGDIEPRGFDLKVTRFSLSSCGIGEIGEGALQVVANQSISLHSLRINNLHGNALHGLRILRSGEYQRPSDQEPQICLSALTVGPMNVQAAARDPLQLDEDSPVSMYGRVCAHGSEHAQSHTQCIGGGSAALVSLKVFRSRCCFDGVGSQSPACPTYGWVPYVAAAAAVVLLTAVALFCYMRKLRAKRWRVVSHQREQPRISMVPSVDGLGSDTSDLGSPECDFRGGDHWKQGGSEAKRTTYEEVEERGAGLDTGPLASWLQTLRETMPPQPARGSAETIELADNGAQQKPGTSSEPVSQADICVDDNNAAAGSDTESVGHEGTELVERQKSEDVKQKTSPDVQPPEARHQTCATMRDTSGAASRRVGNDQGTQNRLKKANSAPKRPTGRPPGHPTAESGQPSELELQMPVYAQVNKKRKRAPKSDQPTHQVASSTEASVKEKLSSHNQPDDGEPTGTGGAVSTAFRRTASTLGRRQPDLIYAEVFHSLPRVPTSMPGTHQRRRSTVDSSLYDEVYQVRSGARAHNTGPDASSRCSAEYDDTYDGIPIAAKDSDAGSSRSLMRCPLYGEVVEGPHPWIGRGIHGPGAVRRTWRSAEFPLHAEENDGRPVASHDCTVSRERRMYIEVSEEDRSGGGLGRASRTSCLYAEISDFPPTVNRGAVSRNPHQAKAPEVPSYATVSKKTRDPKGKEHSKTGGWLTSKPFFRKGS